MSSISVYNLFLKVGNKLSKALWHASCSLAPPPDANLHDGPVGIILDVLFWPVLRGHDDISHQNK